MKNKLRICLKNIYRADYREEYLTALLSLSEKFAGKRPTTAEKPDEKTAYLITYGDSIQEPGVAPLKSLRKFLCATVQSVITDVHLLPMFPYTSDDGFSVTDYLEINPELGTWADIAALAADFRLMFDFVVNHVSKSSTWFRGYLNDDPRYAGYFLPRTDDFDTALVVRPRTSALFHEYQGAHHCKTAWTTFSEDQVDVNFRHFPLLLEMCNVLLQYLSRGATSIRLDAIGFIWKQSGTSCIHLPEAHAIVKLMRVLTEFYNSGAQIITETNVPHQENISYFGDTTDEAHMVYQFALPPLVLHTLITHDSQKLTGWARGIGHVSANATWFNFLASHDGIGLRPVEGILSDEEKQNLADQTLRNGGRISYKSNPDGSQTVYELNINYLDALINRDEDITSGKQCGKFLAAQFILFSMIGVPAIYIHSLLGSRNDCYGLEESGINRRINREKLNLEKLERELKDETVRQTVFTAIKKLLAIRGQHKAFSPYGSQEVLSCGNDFFCIRRVFGSSTITCIVNVCAEDRIIPAGMAGYDIISEETILPGATLCGYGYLWVK